VANQGRRSNSRGSQGDNNGAAIKLKARIAASSSMNQAIKEKLAIKRAVQRNQNAT